MQYAYCATVWDEDGFRALNTIIFRDGTKISKFARNPYEALDVKLIESALICSNF